MRIALGLEYLGTNYHGWQRQDGLHTIQNTLEEALAKVAASSISVICAGRTDVGVHAKEQVVHFDTNTIRAMRAWVMGGNHYLPYDVRIQWAKEMPDDFHARFSAFFRHYRYFVYNHDIPSALYKDRMCFYPKPLCEQLMQEAARDLIGEHDFSAFRGIGCQSRSRMRNVMKIDVKREGKVIAIDVKANAFLQHMVRNIVGVLFAIGSREKPVSWAKEVLDGKDRKLGGVTAKACGLYFVAAGYPERFFCNHE